jgi:4-amino-4-deoxy-L-arabinose transferase-like glycosyltransferase
MAESIASANEDGQAQSEQRKAWGWWLLLVAVLAVGAWFRLAGGNWDRGLQLNVDDSFVAETALRRVNLPPGTTYRTLLDPSASPINPRANGDFFPYGTLPIYVTKGAAALAQWTTGDLYFGGLGGVQLTGRAMSGVFDLTIVLVLVVLGTRVWGKWWGLAAGALYAFAILPIQTSHFFITDSFMTAFMALTLLCGVALLQTGRLWLAPLAGVCAGLAMACKLSAAPVLAVPVGAVLLRGVVELTSKERSERGTVRIGEMLLAVVVMAVLIGLGALVGLFLGDPYAVLDPGPYLKQLQDQAAIQNGAIDEWFTRKYVGTTPVLHQWGQLMLLGVGPVVGVIGTVGVGLAAWRVVFARNSARRELAYHSYTRTTGAKHAYTDWAVAGLLLVGAGVYLGAVGFAEAKWVRYILPLVPYLCLFAVGVCAWMAEWGKRGKGVGYGVAGVMAATALVGAVAVMPIYRTEHTQIEASRWVYENLPQGSKIGIEKTAIRMPLWLEGRPDPDTYYAMVEWDPLADVSSEEVLAALRGHLLSTNYMILDSTQATRTAPRMPWRYPVQGRYYELLFSGQLGFEPAHKATSYPRIGPWEVPDEEWADVSFMDSSHPPIFVFRKARELGAEEWDRLFAEAVQRDSVATRHKP